MNRVLLIISVILAFIVIGSFLFFSIFAPKTQTPPAPVIQYSPSPTSFPSSQPLTPEEKNYPEAYQQRFFSEDENQLGALIVISNPSEARAMIDLAEEEASSDSTLPVNITPFKVSNMPVGQHNLMLFKTGYNFSTTQFNIEANKVTRLYINLVPQESNVGY